MLYKTNWKNKFIKRVYKYIIFNKIINERIFTNTKILLTKINVLTLISLIFSFSICCLQIVINNKPKINSIPKNLWFKLTPFELPSTFGNIDGRVMGRFTLFKISNSNDVKKLNKKNVIEINSRTTPIILKFCGINLEFILIVYFYYKIHQLWN